MKRRIYFDPDRNAITLPFESRKPPRNHQMEVIQSVRLTGVSGPGRSFRLSGELWEGPNGAKVFLVNTEGMSIPEWVAEALEYDGWELYL